MGHPRPGVAVPSLLRRHSAPVRPAFPLVTPPAASTGRANSALSTSSPAPASSSESLKRRSSEVEMPSDEEEIQVGDQIVSLVCPISLKRIIVPGKGRSCRHVQCFDLETFVKLSRLNCKWKCGICSDTIEKNDLIVSEPFLHLLAAYPESEKCIMRADGTHARYAKSSMPRKKARLSGDQPSRTTEVVDLCDDDEEPVANETTAKPDDQSSVHSQQSQITEVARGQSPREATPPQAAQHFPVVTKRFTEEQARYRFPPRSASVESPREESPLFWEDRQGIKKRTTSPSPISQTEREERIQRIFQAAAASAATCEPKDDTLSLPRSVGGERACRVAARNCTHNQQDADASIDSHVAAPLC
ncbi:MIZ/SP-RING zinc finger-domain-containing protein [Gaertneriomyces semiglobifer]|nr:MIZ/SP-RING zinc finger-domain-containing protein [Gaertneriomyces semiglobifer]